MRGGAVEPRRAFRTGGWQPPRPARRYQPWPVILVHGLLAGALVSVLVAVAAMPFVGAYLLLAVALVVVGSALPRLPAVVVALLDGLLIELVVQWGEPSPSSVALGGLRIAALVGVTVGLSELVRLRQRRRADLDAD